MITRLYKITLALVVSMGFTAVFVANLAQAQQANRGSTVYCVVPASETPGPFAACDEVFQSIQTAVSAADDGSEVWVAGGLYTDVQFLSYTYSSQVLLVTPSLTIRGGFTPPFTAPPDFTDNPTILDAQGQESVIRLLSPDVTLEGLHITGGDIGAVWVMGGTSATLNNNVIYDNKGSYGSIGVIVQDSTAVLKNNIIRDNIGRLTTTGYDEKVVGGGIFAFNSHLTLDTNTIMGNVALSGTTNYRAEAYGGGIGAESSIVTLTNNVIFSNTAVISGTPGSFQDYHGFGGGIALIDSPALIKDNQLRGNTAVYRGASGLGGGLYAEGDQDLLITENSFIGNTAAVYDIYSYVSMGGGLFLGVNGYSHIPTIAVADNLIQGNTAVISGNSGYGGGMAVAGTNDDTFSVNINRNRFLYNTATMTGEIGVAGGLTLFYANASLANNQFLGNTASNAAQLIDVGGAFYANWGQTSLNGDLFQGNESVAAETAVGGAIGLGNGRLDLTNTVFIDNWAGSAGSALATIGDDGELNLQHTTIANNKGGDGSAILISDGRIIGEPPGGMNRVTMTNTILVSHTIGISVTGSHTITAAGLLWYNTPTPVLAGPEATVTLLQEVMGDPRFAPDGYHIMAGSAAIGNGIPSLVHLDIDGEGRPFLPALGADEFWPNKFYLPGIQR
jgi:hypothetical protein